jgi:hypothetical protein
MTNDNDKSKKQCDEMLFAMLGNKDLVNKWWSSPNKAFNNQTPFLVYCTDPQIIKDYLIWHCFCAGG